jgi:hypothetical protein
MSFRIWELSRDHGVDMVSVSDAVLMLKEDEEVHMRKTTLLELDGMNSCSAATAPKNPCITLRKSSFFFSSNTLATMSGWSEAVCPAKRLASISGHLGLAVIVRKMSGTPNLRTIAMESWKSWFMKRGLPTTDEGRTFL